MCTKPFSDDVTIITGSKITQDYLRQVRKDRLLRELDHDPYHSKLKIKEPNACPE